MDNKTGKLICYNLKASNISRSDTDRFLREFAGHNDKSNHGKYTYRKRGILDEIPHIKLARSVIVVSDDKSTQIINLTKKYRINTYARDICLTDEDINKLKK